MRRDLLVTALIFGVVGFASAYLYFNQTANRSLLGSLPEELLPEESSLLPEGHPPFDVAQRWQELREQAEASPEDSRAALELANFLYDLERWDDAVFWYRRTLELDPRDTDARTDLATCYYNLERFDEAMAAYRGVLELERNKPQALYGLALAQLRGPQDKVAARRSYQQLRRNYPDFPGVEHLEQLLKQESPRR